MTPRHPWTATRCRRYCGLRKCPANSNSSRGRSDERRDACRQGEDTPVRPLSVVCLALILFALALLLPRHSGDGLVTDERGGPVAGALVRHKGAAASAHTDADGRFRLPHSPAGFTAWKEGYFIAGGRSRFL